MTHGNHRRRLLWLERRRRSPPTPPTPTPTLDDLDAALDELADAIDGTPLLDRLAELRAQLDAETPPTRQTLRNVRALCNEVLKG